MGRRIALLLTFLSVALIAALLPAASFADPGHLPTPVSYPSAGLQPPAGLASSSGQIAVMVELAPPNRLSGIGSAAARQLLAAAQGALAQSLPALGAHVLFTSNLAYNGMAISLPAAQLSQLRNLPNVAHVSIITPKLPSDSAGARSATLPSIASAVAEATGQGVRIGIVDHGIDYTHADFGGAGTPAAYTANNPTVVEAGSFPTSKVDGYDFAGDAYDASSPTNNIPVPDADPLECNSDAHAGQGSLLAGLAAGYGVAADGTTYHGPYGPDADLSGLLVAPGVAPEAQLYALKIFGCQGSTALLTQAIDRAIDPNGDGNPADHLDVLLIALGTPFGSADDPDAIAVDNAVRAGIVVVVAVGDNVQTFYSVNSPASASLAIAVGASDASGVAAISARGPQRGNTQLRPDLLAPGVAIASAGVGLGSATKVMTGTAVAAAQVSGAAALLRQLHSAWAPAQVKAALLNSAATVSAPPSLAGAGQLDLAALARLNLLAHGEDGGGLNYGAPWVAAATTLTRTLQLENTSDMDRMLTLSATAVATETGVTVRLPAAPLLVPAHSSVQAPIELALDPSGLEFTPDASTALLQDSTARHYLAEHGGSIEISTTGSASGTRVRPAHAAHFTSVDFYLDDQLLDNSLDSREVQEYMNTTPGAHMVKLRKPGASPNSTPLFSAPVVLLDNHDYTLIVVGRPHELGIVVVDETPPALPPAGQALIHYVNANRVGHHWDIGPLDVYIDGVLQVPALAIGATSDYFALAPGIHEVEFRQAGVTHRRVAHKTFVASAGQAILVGTGRHDDDDGELNDNEQRAFIGYSEPRGVQTLLARVPYQIFPTLAANAGASGPLHPTPGAHSFALALHNSGARNSGLNGTLATARTPLASAFELEASSPQLAGLSANLSAADLQYVGVTSSYSITQNLDSSTSVYFGLSSYGPWSTPNEIEFLVYIDSNRDGRDDFVLVNNNWGSANGKPASDVFINALYPLLPDGTPVLAPSYALWGTFAAPIESTINIAPFNTAVMFQSATITNLAPPLDPNNPTGPKGPAPSSFCYHVETRARDANNFGLMVDRVPDASTPALAGCAGRAGELFYDLQNAVIAPINTTNFVFGAPTAARPIFVDTEGGAITGAVNPVQLAMRPTQKLLILHHHNAPFPQAEIVNLAVAVPATISASMSPRVHVPLAMR